MDELHKREWLYRGIGIFLGVGVIGSIMYGSWFIVEAFDVALNPSLIAPTQAVTFNLDLAKQLQLLK